MKIYPRLWALLGALLIFTGCEDASRWAYENALKMEIARAGLLAKTVTTDDGIHWHTLVSESHSSSQPATAVLLVHGFGADATNWVRFAGEMEEEFYFVVPDLPGHGNSSRDISLDYTMAAQASRLLKLMDSLDIDHFHVAGNSMGGAISLALARQAPDKVLSIGLIDSAGLTLQTPAFKALQDNSNSNPLIAHSAADFRTTLDWAMEDPPFMPGFFIDVMGQKKADNAPVAEAIFKQLNSDPGVSLNGRGILETIQQPALILWGRDDRLLGVDNVQPFLDQLPQARAIIFDNIGHLPMTEAPAKSAAAFRSFWQQNTP